MRDDAPSILRDDWLSELMGHPAYRMLPPRTTESNFEEQFTALTAVLDPLRISRNFVFIRRPDEGDDFMVALLAEQFDPIEVSCRFTKVLDHSDAYRPDPRVRLAIAADEDAVAEIARISFEHSRFHSDPKIPRETANRIKEAWARNYFRGARGDAMIVAEEFGRVCGFNLLLNSQHPEAVIDLIAVRPDARGSGLGRAMVEFGEALCLKAERMSVGTQHRNEAAIHIYTHLGFELSATEIVLHWHSGIGAVPE